MGLAGLVRRTSRPAQCFQISYNYNGLALQYSAMLPAILPLTPAMPRNSNECFLKGGALGGLLPDVARRMGDPCDAISALFSRPMQTSRVARRTVSHRLPDGRRETPSFSEEGFLLACLVKNYL